jgi:tetratricopeptide (TPR) repeat protein
MDRNSRSGETKQSKKKSATTTPAAPGDDRFGQLLGETRAEPHRDELWDALEELAAELQKPDEVSELFVAVVEQALPAPLANSLGERAARFHAEWFGDDAPALVRVLTRVLEIDPSATFPLERLAVVLTGAARWSELLALYDGALAAAPSAARRLELLDEAANVAKDFAGDSDRAIGYLQQLYAARPGDVQVASSLERLLERQERFRDLIGLWKARIEGASTPQDAAALRARVAECFLMQLRDASAALAETRQLLDEGDEAAALPLLERILAAPDASPEVRERAIALLRSRYEEQGRDADVIRVLELALARGERGEEPGLRRDIGLRLASAGKSAEAMEQFLALLVITPADTAAEAELRALAEKTGAHARHAEGLVAAAEASTQPERTAELLTAAAEVRAEKLDDVAGATTLYERVLAAVGPSTRAALPAARRLAILLARAGRSRERLDILDRLAELEPSASERRDVLAEIARESIALGDADRALAAWQRRFDADPRDLEALSAQIDLLAAEKRAARLVEALRRRSLADVPALQKRADLVRIAHIQVNELGDPDLAMATWAEVAADFGEDAEVVDALSHLYTMKERYAELADLLSRAGARDTARVTELLARLGDVLRSRLGDTARAAQKYRDALRADPSLTLARDGLRALVDDEGARSAAVEGLVSAYEATGDWRGLLDVLEARLTVAPSDTHRVRILAEAAKLREVEGENPQSALEATARAFVLAPDDRTLEEALLRLATATGQHALAAQTLGQAAAASLVGSPRALALTLRRARVLAEQLGDFEGALESAELVARGEPARRDVAEAVIDAATKVGRWDAAVARVFALAAETGRMDEPLLSLIETRAGHAGAWDVLAGAVAAATAGATGLSATVRRDLEKRIAAWHRDRRSDAASAEAAFARAVAHDPDDVEALRALLALRRATPSAALYQSLVQLAALTPNDVDALREAAELAAGALGDAALTRTALTRLYERSVQLLRRGGATGTRDVGESAAWAHAQLLAIMDAAGETKAAFALLLEGSALPLPAEQTRAMRVRAAELAAGPLGDRTRAIDLYRAVLDEAPSDTKAFDSLAELFTRENRLADLLALRKLELGAATDAERKLALRLDIARLVGDIESKGGRLEALRANLDDHPGHVASIEAISRVLRDKHAFSELAELLSTQAQRVEQAGDTASAARLWGDVAELAENPLHDVSRALAAYRKVVALAPTAIALDALARLHTDRGEHRSAVEWLEKRLTQAEPAERTAVALRLARAQLAAGQKERATQRLEAALADDAASGEVRELLAGLYRASAAWAPLGKLLADSTVYIEDDALLLERVREAADVYVEKLKKPDLAIPVLETAVKLAPDDRTLKSMLAEAYRVGARLDEAKDVLESLVADFGRRRTPERAAFHFQLAKVFRAKGDVDHALEQYDSAASMDVGNAAVMLELGGLARESGQMDRAERAYRALLLLVRKQQDDSLDAVGVPEVQFELSRLAAARKQDGQAKELLESAVAAATQTGVETRRFARALVSRGEYELAKRALELHLEALTDSTERAPLLASLADLLEQHLGQDAAALAARLEALAGTPADDALHDAARAVAKKIGRTADYVDAAQTIIDGMRRTEEDATVAHVLLRLGLVIEEDLGDAKRAAGIYTRVEESGVRVADAWLALARVAGVTGDFAEQQRVLELVVQEDVGAATTDALYRLAELRVDGAIAQAASDEGAAALGVGLDTLERAVAREARWAVAGEVLRRAAEAFPSEGRVLGLYEKVARQADDALLLLDYLERHAALADATLADVREGVEAAGVVGDGARAEKLLERGVALARATSEGLATALWTVTQLAERRRAAGDVPGALRWLEVAVESAFPEDAFGLGLELARQASQPGGDLQIAANTYEKLKERDPADRQVWLPLLAVYRQIGDRKRYAAHVASTLDALLDPADRNAVRMEFAKFLLEKKKDKEATAQLRDILGEDPDHAEAGAVLGEVLQRLGSSTELLELVQRQLDGAKDRNDAETVAQLTLKLVALFQVEGRRDDSIDAIRSALDFAPTSRPLLEVLVQLVGPDANPRDRAEVMERLLAVETGAAASELAGQLAELYTTLEDETGVERALALGHRSAPGDEAIRRRLDSWYREHGDLTNLAAMLVLDGSRDPDPECAVARYREAATLYREQLSQPALAADALSKALVYRPQDAGLLSELVASLSAAGDLNGAVAQVGGALERTTDGTARALLLRERAKLHTHLGDDHSAVTDLEEAYALSGGVAAADLAYGLDVARGRAADAGAVDAERAFSMRLVQVLSENGDPARARDVLAAWVTRAPNDLEALRALVVVDTQSERWDDVVLTCNGLVQLEQGEAQIDAALRLADAATRAGRPEDARAGLEYVFSMQPTDGRVREQLRALYSATGADRELATILLADAEASAEPQVRFDALRQAGALLVRAGDPGGALVPLVAAYDLKSDDHELTVTLVDAYTATGAHAEAGQLLEAAIAAQGKRRTPELAVLQQRMARLAGAAGAKDTELEWYKVALDSDKNNGDIAADVAELAMELGDAETALKALRAITLMKQTGRMSRAVAFLRQAQISHQKGDARRAVLWARKAKEEDPNLTEADDFLRELGEH